MKFREFSFSPELQQAVDQIGFVDCTPVQEQSFCAYFEGKDIYAQSQTGTGKTAAFMLCALQELIRRNQSNHKDSEESSAKENLASEIVLPTSFAEDIKILVLAPTRELAQQIEQESKLLSQFLPVQVAAFYGGVGYEEQHSHLKSGVQIIAGTPGRIIDLAKSGELCLEQVYVAVLDEADRMLDMGFIDDVRWIMNQLPPAAERLTMLFSATLNARVGNLTWEFMRGGHIAEITIESEQVTTETVEQELYHVANREKLRLLLSLIEKYNPESAIIFCNTKGGASFLEGRLRDRGYQVRALIGDLPQARRTQIVGRLKARKLRFVVATDVASRGLHIDGLPIVINYDLPDEAENYVHRIGRTARAGAVGRAISLACERYVYNLADIERYIGNKIPVLWLSEEEILADSGGHQRGEHRKDQRDRPKNEHNSRRPRKQKGDSEYGRSVGRTGHKKSGQAVSLSKEHSRPSPRVNLSKTLPKDKESRLRYYEQKYGEHFGAEAKDSEEAAPSTPERAPRNRTAIRRNSGTNRNSVRNRKDSSLKDSKSENPERSQKQRKDPGQGNGKRKRKPQGNAQTARRGSKNQPRSNKQADSTQKAVPPQSESNQDKKPSVLRRLWQRIAKKETK